MLNKHLEREKKLFFISFHFCWHPKSSIVRLFNLFTSFPSAKIIQITYLKNREKIKFKQCQLFGMLQFYCQGYSVRWNPIFSFSQREMQKRAVSLLTDALPYFNDDGTIDEERKIIKDFIISYYLFNNSIFILTFFFHLNLLVF